MVCSLLIAKEHAGVLPGGVIHRDHQIPHGIGHPAVGAGILVNHHAHKRHAFALDAVFAPELASFDHTSALEYALEPAVVACAGKFGPVLAVKVGDVPTCKATLVQLHNVVNLAPTGASLGDLAQAFVQ